MQMAIIVSCPLGFPRDADIVETLQRILGVRIGVARRDGAMGNWALEFSLECGEVAGIEFQVSQRRAVVEVNQVPTHLQWAVVEALRRLGGNPNQFPPSFAAKSLNEVRWWHKMQWRRRVFGR